MGRRAKSLTSLIAVAGTLIPAVALAGAASPANVRPLAESASGALLGSGVYAKDQFTLGALRPAPAQACGDVTYKVKKKKHAHPPPPPKRHHHS
ncbi:MAG TPA: hypothetical protein VGF50_04180 [Caulobacteraceae bacterium]|jgi:hypothetical protein